MSDLGFAQVIALAFGGALVVLGFAGLMPVVLRWRRRASLPNVYMSELGSALASTDAFIRPWVPSFALQPRELLPEAREQTTLKQSEAPQEPPHEEVAMAAEELKAQLFAIRMTLSDVTAEVQSVREVLNEQGLADEFEYLGIDLPEAA
jgi:hypothetical protein